MEEGTFTLVDEGIFYPVVKIKENNSNADESVTSDSEDDSDEDDEKQIDEVSEKNDHRKVVRRKSSESTAIERHLNKNKNKLKQMLKREHKNEDSEDDEDEEEPKLRKAFEFCTTIEDNLEIKKEIPSDIEKESSDDDIPLAALDKQKNYTKQEKRSHKDHSASDLELDKIKIKIKKVEKDEETSKESYKFFCSKCNKFCKNKKKYRSHIRKVHGKLFKCKICIKSYDKKTDLEDHYNYHTGNRPYCCYLCDNETFKTKFSLKRHMNKLHSGRPTAEKKEFPCYVCGKILYTANSLEEHLRLHTGEKPIECKLCDKTFSRVNDLRQHLNVHEELWKCKFCQKCFTTPFKLKEHTRMHTGEMPYECDKCDRKFARVADFRYHFGTHLGIKPYICDECGMRFTTSSSVTRHRLNMHQTGPKLYDCPQCTKKFHTRARLNTHIKNHENNKKFRCELCPAARNSLAELNKHVLIHGGEFRCDTCHRGFQSAERLAAHTLRHDIAGKPYACFVCSIGYRSSQSLNKHLSTVHRNEDIPKIAPQHLCTICGQVFELKDKLNRHLKESHIVVVVGEIHSLEDEIDSKKAVIHIKDVVKVIEVPITKSTINDNNKNDETVSIESNKNSKIKQNVIKMINESNIQVETVKVNVEPSKESAIVLANKTIEESTAIVQPEPKVVPNILNIPSVTQSAENLDNAAVKDLSSSSELKPGRNSPVKMSYNKTYEQNSFPRVPMYDEAIAQQNNRLLHTNYRPAYDNYQIPVSNHANSNPWYTSKPNEIAAAHRQANPRAVYEARQRYDLRMPRFNTPPMNQDYRNMDQRLPYPNQRLEIPQIPPRNRDDRKYYYETDQRLMPDDRRKYNQHASQTLTDLSSRQVREYPNHMLQTRDYIQSPLGVCDLSNSNSQSPHYPHHSFSSPHHFFQNFRDLQHRMLGVQDYGHPRHPPSLAGMDMTNQRLNPTSPLSPYNQTSPHLLENMSPMSRNSYEEATNHHVPNSHVYHGNHVQSQDNAATGNGESANPKDKTNAEQMSNGGPYEMRVAAN